ncbi:hypothetical protein BS50DRAFT_369566 [Corynespora cassiicola Philippines]|uniref:Uncharacterized protein n=1 Tax=Corynespora cassiicola Philippines TaxID=1448308 RepID=A0A2T2NME3_CORCC|nr:hypothetical protein BS50DRAFT_369566 [Corynespora cassiicola Philippines]
MENYMHHPLFLFFFIPRLAPRIDGHGHGHLSNNSLPPHSVFPPLDAGWVVWWASKRADASRVDRLLGVPSGGFLGAPRAGVGVGALFSSSLVFVCCALEVHLPGSLPGLAWSALALGPGVEWRSSRMGMYCAKRGLEWIELGSLEWEGIWEFWGLRQRQRK